MVVNDTTIAVAMVQLLAQLFMWKWLDTLHIAAEFEESSFYETYTPQENIRPIVQTPASVLGHCPQVR